MKPAIKWWNKADGSAVDHLRALAERDPLVTSFADGLVLVAMEIEPAGSYLTTWTVSIASSRTLPEVELFIAKVATYIVDEPIE